jgi:hypothetical protein
MFRTLFIGTLLVSNGICAQDLDLLSGLEEDSSVVYTSATFKTTRVINSHSLENTHHGVLDFKIQHRFGFVNGGIDEFFGLDQSTIRLGFDYGLTENLVLGVGRSSFQKTLDGFLKYRVFRQCDKGCEMPLTASIVTSAMMDTRPWEDPERENYFSSRMSYSFQLIVGRKFNERLSLQLMPGLVHRNLVTLEVEEHDVINIGVAGRYKLSKRVAFNAEYFHVLPDQLLDIYENSLSMGVDIETGGHVFQLHITNSPGMFERAYITETTGSWADGDIRFGFNISRVFTLHEPKRR